MKKNYELKENIENIVKKYSGESGIIVKINDEIIFSHNEDKIFQSASIIKLFILEALLEKINNSKLSFSDKIKISNENKVLGFGILRILDDNLEVSVKDLAMLMITLSDNTATNLLIDILGLDFIQNFILENGYTGTKLQRKMYDFDMIKKGLDNFTTAKDSLLVLDRLCKNETSLSMLKTQLCNSKIPLYFFRKIEVAHKTGDMTNIEHDVARLFFKNIHVDLIILANGDNKESILLNNNLGECIYNFFK